MALINTLDVEISETHPSTGEFQTMPQCGDVARPNG